MSWRQGFLIEFAELAKLDVEGIDETSVAVVISHDCDLVQPDAREPIVEIVLGNLIDAPDGSLQHAKSTRRLHIRIEHGGTTRYVCLDATQKRNIKKSKITTISTAGRASVIREDAQTLRAWLASRYRRAAFPSAFDVRMHAVNEALDKVSKKYGDRIRGVFFDLNEDGDTELEDNEPYEIGVFVVFPGLEDHVETAAKAAANEIADAFNRAFPSDHAGPAIKLLQCNAISDDEITFAEVGRLMNRRFEHRSLAVVPPQVMPDAND